MPVIAAWQRTLPRPRGDRPREGQVPKTPALRLADHFDLICGTSTGTIIAADLARGVAVAPLIEVYLTLARDGFQRHWWLGGTLVPKFRAVTLETAIRARQIGISSSLSPALT